MATRTWVLTDVEQDIYVEQISLSSDQLGGLAAGYAVVKRTLRGGLRQGVDVIEVHNGLLRLVVVPTRGMGIWRASTGSLQLKWDSPVRGPVHPAFVNLWEPSGIGWLDGFDELVVRCGLESNGAPVFNPNGTLLYPLHGKIANIPAHHVSVTIDDHSGTISVRGIVDEARLFGNKMRMETVISTKVGQPWFAISDTISNLSAEPGDLELLYHVNFGAPLLEPGARVLLPAAKVAPRDATAAANLAQWECYGPEMPGAPEAVFFLDLRADEQGNTQATLCNAAATQGVSIRFNKQQLPYFTLWKNRQSVKDGYVTGLEPGLNFPNPKWFEKQQGRVVSLAPGHSRRFELAIEVHGDAAAVSAAQQQVAAIQAGATPVVLDRPDPDWSVT